MASLLPRRVPDPLGGFIKRYSSAPSAGRISRYLRAVGVIALAVACIAPPANAEPLTSDTYSLDGQDPAIMAEMRVQEHLHPAAMALIEVAQNEQTSGYAGVAYEGKGITLYYKGPLSPEMAGAVVEASRIGPVTVVTFNYSHEELMAASARLEAADRVAGDSDNWHRRTRRRQRAKGH